MTATEDVSYDAPFGRWIARTSTWATLAAFTTIGIDAIALLKGDRDFVAIISAQLSRN